MTSKKGEDRGRSGLSAGACGVTGCWLGGREVPGREADPYGMTSKKGSDRTWSGLRAGACGVTGCVVPLLRVPGREADPYGMTSKKGEDRSRWVRSGGVARLAVGGEEGLGDRVAGAEGADFEVDVVDVGEGGADRGFDAVDGALDGFGGEALAELDVHGEQDDVGAEVHGEGVGDLVDVGVGCGEGADGMQSFPVGSFADEQAFAFDDEKRGDGEEDETDDDGGGAVRAGHAEGVAEKDADKGGEQAEQGGGVLKEDGEDGGVLALVDGVEDGRVVGFGAELADADEEGVALEEEGDAEDGEGPGGVLRCGGMADVADAFGDGDAAAEDEDEQSDDERPEVELFAVAEGVGFVGGLAALLLAEEKKGTVAAVDDGVDGFRQHGGGAGEEEADDLGDGDADVGGDGDEDGFAGGGGHGGVFFVRCAKGGSGVGVTFPVEKQIPTE